MRKRLLTFLFATCLVCSLCACGSSGESGTNTDPGSTSDVRGENGGGNSVGGDIPTKDAEDLTAFERLYIR